MGGYTYAADNPASSSDPTGFDDWYNYPGQNPCVIDCNTPSPSPAPAPTGTSSGSSSSPSSTVPAAQELPHANPNEKIDPHGFTAVFDAIFTAPYHFANCTFWLSGSSGHQESCDIAGGIYSGGAGGGGVGVGAVEGAVEGDVAGSVEGAGVRVVEGDAAAAAGAGAKAVDDAAADMADLVAMKRANAQARAEEADAGAAKASEPTTGASGTKPASADQDAVDESLRTAVHKKYKEITTQGSDHYQTNRERGPVLTGAMDNVTGEITYGQNTGIPSPLHPILQDRIDNFEGEGADFKGVPGSHSEINALNEGMLARPGATLEEFTVYNVRLKGTQKGQRIIRCDNCQQITDGVREIE